MSAQENRKRLFNVELNVEATKLIEEVERLYGKSVAEEYKDFPDGRFGNSRVDDDGTPRIQINPVSGKSADVIIHELLHLKMRGEGHPILGYAFEPKIDTDENFHYMLFVQSQLYDSIQHRGFNSEIKRIGFDPTGKLKDGIQKAISTNHLEIDIPNQYWASVARSLFFYRLQIEFDDSKLLTDFNDFYVKNGWQQNIEEGNQLVKVVTNNNPKQPQEIVNTYIAAIGYLLKKQFTFSLLEYKERQLGNHKQIIANVHVTPA